MPPEESSVGTPQEWLRRAKSNLARAKQPKPDEAIWEDLCFDAQQAAERAVKAVLRHRSGVTCGSVKNVLDERTAEGVI